MGPVGLLQWSTVFLHQPSTHCKWDHLLSISMTCNRVVNIWNRLPASDCHFETFNSFKSFLAAQNLTALLLLTRNSKFVLCAYFCISSTYECFIFNLGAVDNCIIMCIVVNKQTNKVLQENISSNTRQNTLMLKLLQIRLLLKACQLSRVSSIWQ